MKPGKILFPTEGEGRNAVFAAESGWDVSAFDLSESGKKKAEQLAVSRGVSLEYQVGNLSEITYPAESFDALVLVFTHFQASLRESFHRKLFTFLKQGGTLILEGFSKDHLKFSSINPLAGGPKDPSMLFSEEELRSDFRKCKF